MASVNAIVPLLVDLGFTWVVSHSAISNCGCDCEIVCVIVLCSGDCVRERERERAILSDWT